MDEKYLKWILLGGIIGEYMDEWKDGINGATFIYHDKEYDLEKMKQDYIRLTKELLQDYEVPAPKQDESGKGSIWDNTFDGTATLL